MQTPAVQAASAAPAAATVVPAAGAEGQTAPTAAVQPTAGSAPTDATAPTPGGAPAAATAAVAPASRPVASGVLTRSTESFKVLTECPLIVMLLFQLYPRYIQTTIPSLIPMMVQTLALRPPRAGSRHRLACADFMAAQVKTLSFLTYLLRAFADFMRPYQESIPKCVIQVHMHAADSGTECMHTAPHHTPLISHPTPSPKREQLLLMCPPESASIRKDILVATRHINASSSASPRLPSLVLSVCPWRPA